MSQQIWSGYEVVPRVPFLPVAWGISALGCLVVKVVRLHRFPLHERAPLFSRGLPSA